MSAEQIKGKATTVLILGIVSLFCCGVFNPLYAQQDFGGDFGGGGEAAIAFGAVFLVVMLIALVIGLAIAILVYYLVYTCFNAIPEEHRLMEPWQVWLLLIPVFNLIWNFFVYPKMAKSFQSYFNSVGRTDVGDCGYQIGLWYAICAAVSFIPYLNCLSIPAALVLLIIFLVKAFSLKGQIGGQTVT